MPTESGPEVIGTQIHRSSLGKMEEEEKGRGWWDWRGVIRLRGREGSHMDDHSRYDTSRYDTFCPDLISLAHCPPVGVLKGIVRKTQIGLSSILQFKGTRNTNLYPFFHCVFKKRNWKNLHSDADPVPLSH